MTKKLFWLFPFLLIPTLARGQGSRFDSTAQKTVQNFIAPIPGATIVVCTSAGTGTPCSPTTPIYTDSGLTQQIPGSTFTADSNGNFGFWAPPGTYTYSITATGVTGKLYTIVLPVNLASNNTLTGSNTFTGPLSLPLPHTLTNGGFNNLLTGSVSAARTWTLQDTSDTFVFRNTTDTINNKTLTGASNGNSVTLLCSSGPAAAIVGNSSAQTFFSCTIPASAVANLKGLRVTLVWSHSKGTATVTYGLTLNGVACWPSNNTASTVGGLSQIANFIETGSTTGNVMTQQGFFSFTATTLTGLAWTAGQTLAATFNVANTDQITPLFFLVELIQ